MSPHPTGGVIKLQDRLEFLVSRGLQIRSAYLWSPQAARNGLDLMIPWRVGPETPKNISDKFLPHPRGERGCVIFVNRFGSGGYQLRRFGRVVVGGELALRVAS